MLLVRSLTQSVAGWRQNPFRMLAQLIVSTIVGQALFWRVGYDQLGIGMDPKREFGVGSKLADKVASRLPNNATTAWVLKVIEILTDLGKMPIEGKAYARHGITPDVVACAVTQPAWSAIEAVEKTRGAIVYPERVNTPEQIRLSLACIYGSLVRYALGFLVIATGKYLNRWLTDPIEKLLRLVFRRS